MWKVLVFASGEAAGSETVEVFDSGVRGRLGDAASAAFAIGSTVA